jgi:hypothetical protein
MLEIFQMENNLKKVISDLNKSRGLGSEGVAAAGGSAGGAEANPISKVPIRNPSYFLLYSSMIIYFASVCP